jgi:hypothetical protein
MDQPQKHPILTAEPTKAALADDFPCRRIGRLVVEGKTSAAKRPSARGHERCGEQPRQMSSTM